MSMKCVGKYIRKIVQVGDGSAVFVPREYLKSTGLTRGDLVEVIFNDKVLQIAPIDKKEIERKLAKASV